MAGERHGRGMLCVNRPLEDHFLIGLTTPYVLEGVYLHVHNKPPNFSSHAMKAYRRIRGKAPLILNRGNKWRYVVNYMPRAL